MTIRFYDSRGELRDTREISGRLLNNFPMDSLIERSGEDLIPSIRAHCNYMGGHMEISAATEPESDIEMERNTR